jgi:hypothetical protein
VAGQAGSIDCEISLNKTIENGLESYQFEDGRVISTVNEENQFAIVAVEQRPGEFSAVKALAVKILGIQLNENGFPKILAKMRAPEGADRILTDYEVASLTPFVDAKRYFEKRLQIPAVTIRKIKRKGSLK